VRAFGFGHSQLPVEPSAFDVHPSSFIVHRSSLIVRTYALAMAPLPMSANSLLIDLTRSSLKRSWAFWKILLSSPWMRCSTP